MGNCWGTKITSHNVSPAGTYAGSNHNNKQRARRGGGGRKAGGLTLSASQQHSSSRSSRVSAALSMPNSNPAAPRSEGEILQSANVRSFTFNELRTSTRNFRPDSVLGEGGFGFVFKGWIDDNTFAPTRPGTGMVIAVKKLNQQGFQGHREWLAEVNYLGHLSHPNLVKLVGYCLEDEQRLLVYEFMPRGSLENHLFRRGSHFQPLSWNLRMKVALGAAKGLAFLHSDKAKVIYRDFKTSNVLLDSNYNAKLSDFGLAKDGPTGDKSHVSTRVMGTYGYAAPEYLATGHLTAKSDVYSFGVVLLELLSGRRAVDKNRPSSEHNLVDWARPYLSSKRRLFRILDARLGGQYSLSGAHRVAALALQCLSGDSRNRPTMDQVVASLQQLADAVDDGHLLVLGSSGHRSSRSRSRSRRYPNSPPDVYHQVVALNLNAPGAKSAAHRRPTTMRRRLSASPLPEL